MTNYDYNKFYEELEPQIAEALTDVYKKHLDPTYVCGSNEITFNGDVIDKLDDINCERLDLRYQGCIEAGENKPDDIEFMISDLVDEEVPDMIDYYWLKVTGEERR